jgi:hypothetical protein
MFIKAAIYKKKSFTFADILPINLIKLNFRLSQKQKITIHTITNLYIYLCQIWQNTQRESLSKSAQCGFNIVMFVLKPKMKIRTL